MLHESTKKLKFKTAFDFELGRGSDMSHENGVLGGLGKFAKMAKAIFFLLNSVKICFP